MKNFMSRFGGHGVIFGNGKASDSRLPEDQSVDYLLDNYAKEIIPNYFFISSYDAIPEYMGMLDWNQFKKKPVKLGVLEHYFTDLIMQYDIVVNTSIYLTKHQYENVFALIIKTHKQGLEGVVSDYFESYDYVLQVFIRSKDKKGHILDTSNLEKLLLILFYKMDLIYEGYITSFQKSKTYLGKKISEAFETNIENCLIDVDSDDKLADLLKIHIA